MRLITFADGAGPPRPGVLLDGAEERVLDLRGARAASGAPDGLGEASLVDLTALLALGQPGLDAVHALVAEVTAVGVEQAGDVVRPLAEVRLLAPIPRPPRLRDYLTYAGHADGASFALPPAFYEMPIAYDGNPNAVIGPEQEILWPPYSDQLDYELELALVIGKAGRDVPVERAAEHIAGITLLNDVSARDIQGLEMSVRLGPNKGKHSCNVVGPCVATLDGLDEYAIALEARVNGEVWSRGTSRNRQYSFAQVVAWASWGEDLQPGEVIGLGTVEGGCGIELDRWIQPGDVVELEATRIGVLRNRVGAKQATPGAGLDSYRGAPFRRIARTAESAGA